MVEAPRSQLSYRENLKTTWNDASDCGVKADIGAIVRCGAFLQLSVDEGDFFLNIPPGASSPSIILALSYRLSHVTLVRIGRVGIITALRHVGVSR